MSAAPVLAGASAVVTGAGQGLGYDIARHLMAAGADVLVFEIDGDRAEEAARALSEEQPGAHGPRLRG